MQDYYVLKSQTGAIFVKEAEFFEAQGGLQERWGRKWRKVYASSVEHARSIAERWLAKNPNRWPHHAREADPLSESDVTETVSDWLERVGTDARLWAEEFVRIVTNPHFQKENLIEVGFLTGWFANAIEAGRSAGLKEGQLIDKEVMQQTKDRGLYDKLKAAVDHYNSLSPEEKKAHDDAQRENWVKGEMAISAAERAEGRHTRVMADADYSKLEERVIRQYADPSTGVIRKTPLTEGTVTGRFKASDPEPQGLVYPNRKGEFIVGQHLRELGAEPYRVAPEVPEGQTPLDRNLKHRLLDVIDEGKKARDTGDGSPYHGHSLEHCLHSTGRVYRDLQIALDAARAEVRRLGEKLAAVREKLND